MKQDEALHIMKTGVNVFLTGEPGAGKSHTVRRYVAYLRSCGIEPAITASTGIAATHIGGMTLHSWSGIGISSSLTPQQVADIARRDRLAKRINATSTLIIDEISMLPGGTLAMVDRVCREVRQNSEPFGGLQVVFVGDFFQLPPVSRFGEAPAEFAFASDVWQEARPAICYLSEQHRQEDKDFLRLLSAIRYGEFSEEHGELLQTRRQRAPIDGDITKLYAHNADVDRMNAARLAKLPGVSRTYAMSSHGAKALVEQLRRGCLSPEALELKVGAHVMFTKNNFDEGFANGTTGVVAGFDQETLYPVVTLRSGREVTVQPATWAIEADGGVLAGITQFPLRLAWAMTIHKSQGMSLDAAYVDLAGAFAYGQGYVALSRVRTLDGLWLAGVNERSLQVDPTVLAKDAQMREESYAECAKLWAMSDAERTERQEAFVRHCGGRMPVAGEVPVRKLATKGPRYEQTLALLCEGKSLAEVAEERGRTVGTIIEHVEKLRAKQRLPLHQLGHLRGDQDFTEIHIAFALVGDAFLKPAYEHLEGRYSYDALRLARLFFVCE